MKPSELNELGSSIASLALSQLLPAGAWATRTPAENVLSEQTAAYCTLNRGWQGLEWRGGPSAGPHLSIDAFIDSRRVSLRVTHVQTDLHNGLWSIHHAARPSFLGEILLYSLAAILVLF